ILSFDNYGDPPLAKLLNNAAATYNIRIAGMLIELGASLGMDPAAVFQLVQNGSGASWMTSMLPELGVDQIRLLAKDMRLLHAESGALPRVAVDDEQELVERIMRVQELVVDGHAVLNAP